MVRIRHPEPCSRCNRPVERPQPFREIAPGPGGPKVRRLVLCTDCHSVFLADLKAFFGHGWNTVNLEDPVMSDEESQPEPAPREPDLSDLVEETLEQMRAARAHYLDMRDRLEMLRRKCERHGHIVNRKRPGRCLRCQVKLG